MSKSPDSNVSEKNTKAQILEAYHQMLEKLKQQKTPDAAELDLKQQKDRTLIKKVFDTSEEDILTNLSIVKGKLLKSIDGISVEVLSSFQKLNENKQAIELQIQEIEELYQIKKEASTLSTLLASQEAERLSYQEKMLEQKEKLESDIKATEALYQQKKEALIREEREYKEILLRDRKREEDEYAYKLQQTRVREQDAYEAQKKALEQELKTLKEDIAQRHMLMKEQEERYKQLETEVTLFPEKQAIEIQKAEEILRNHLEEQYAHEKALQLKGQENKVQLYEQKIAHLEQKEAQQSQLIKELSEKVDRSLEQVKSIACQALESSAQRNAYRDKNNYKNPDA